MFQTLSLVLIVALVCRISATAESEVINVHMIGHTHDDPGWLKTMDEYFSGTNSSIMPTSVSIIFDTVLGALEEDPQKMYSFCEISFFSIWWKEQTDAKKEKIKALVKNEQLVFLNGGWVMHDEAGAHYVSMIDQTTLGHTFLKEAFDGYTPRVGWQIDPFGHSNTHAWLSSEVGFDALYFGRIDYQDKEKRMAEKNMEMVWKGSESMPEAQVFTGAFTSGNYGPPEGFCFDAPGGTWCADDPIVDDETLSTYNMDTKVPQFIQALEQELSTSRGNNIMMKMGSDMTWSNSRTWFKSIDVLIKQVNAVQSKFKLAYSNPERYTKARAAETAANTVDWSQKTDDFFPYADCAHCT